MLLLKFFMISKVQSWRAGKKNFSILSAIRDENIVKLVGVCLKPKLGMVMEYCANGSLQHVLKKPGVPFGWEEFFKTGPQMLAGIKVLNDHQPQILHRDIKSLNILVTEKMEIRVADFGLSRENTSLSSDSLKSVEGTVQYMAPELLSRVKYSAKSDIFSISIILWEMAYRVVTGNYLVPYGDEPNLAGPASSMILFYDIVNKDLRPKFSDGTPEVLKKLVIETWQKDPAHRPTMEDLILKFKQCQDHRGSHTSEWVKHECPYFGNSKPILRRFRDSLAGPLLPGELALEKSLLPEDK